MVDMGHPGSGQRLRHCVRIVCSSLALLLGDALKLNPQGIDIFSLPGPSVDHCRMDKFGSSSPRCNGLADCAW